MSNKNPKEHRAPAYAWIVPYLSSIARDYGYAIGLHGSMARDLDLMAMPWTEEAKSPDELVEAFRKAVDGIVHPDGTPAGRWSVEKNEFVACTIDQPAKRPHGRLAYNIHMTGGFFIDLSFMPRISKVTT